jgi:hypothetical protein
VQVYTLGQHPAGLLHYGERLSISHTALKRVCQPVKELSMYPECFSWLRGHHSMHHCVPCPPLRCQVPCPRTLTAPTHLARPGSPVQSLTPRQIRLLAGAGPGGHAAHPAPGQEEDAVCNSAGNTTVREIEPPYMFNSRPARRRMKDRLARWVGP